ncbi:MAG: DUF72 domain-containing protein [Persephonella sp.]|nr:DUF72 domain-containing protein [Persephonella sp.]
MKPSHWFRYYSSVFDTVEINSTFYRFPKPSNIKKWYRDSPECFIFSVKANKEITHIKRFSKVKDRINQFYSVISENLKEKTGVFLFQMPPNFRYSQSNLERIIISLNSAFKNAVEFRHTSWWNEEVYTVFRKNNIAFCTVSAPKLRRSLSRLQIFVM